MYGITECELLELLPKSIDANLCSDYSPSQAALIWLRKNLTSKLVLTDTNPTADKAALHLFLECNASCSTWEPDSTSYYMDILIRARQIAKNAIYSGELQASRVTLAKASLRVRPGPGASQGTKHTDFIGKMFNSRLTCYDGGLWSFYKQSLSYRWAHAEKIRMHLYGRFDLVPAARLTFAPKKKDISRVINTEASVEMLFQLGVGSCFEDVLLSEFNISLDKQPSINRLLAKLGSIDGSSATVDLKSSSDLISMKFAKWFFDPRTFKILDGLRAKCIQLPREYGNEIVELNMLSTMGNGFTFPCQTFIFSCICKAVYESLGLPTNTQDYPHFSVFGDDIVCAGNAYNRLIECLEWCGFTVNRSKSFNSGAFRESCGQDYFKGVNIRSVYLKDLRHETHIYSAFNRLARWSIVHNIDISGVLYRLRELVGFRPVPFDVSDAAGFKCSLAYSGKLNKHGVTRYKALVPKDRKRRISEYDTNPDGTLVGVLGGYASGGRPGKGTTDEVVTTGTVTLRQPKRPRFVTKKGKTPSWDFHPNGLAPRDYDMLYTLMEYVV